MKYLWFIDAINSCKAENKHTDISHIIERGNTMTPNKLKLKYSDEEQLYKTAPDVIISNFCKRFSETSRFPLEGMRKLGEILKLDHEKDTTRAKWSLLVHLMKSGLQIEITADFILAAALMTIDNTANSEWESAVRCVVKHSEINQIIDDLIAKFGFSPKSSRHIDVVFVTMNIEYFRGWSGVHKLYINLEHFIRKSKDGNVPEHIRKTLLELDLMALTMHQLAHVKLREAVDDFNFSTPSEADRKGFDRTHREFGALAEIAIFGQFIDWFGSQRIDKAFAENIIAAIRSNRTLPTNIHKADGIATRPDPTLFALDVYERTCFF